MWTWFRRLFAVSPPQLTAAPVDPLERAAAADAVATAVGQLLVRTAADQDERLPRALVATPEFSDLVDSTKRNARALAKLSARVETIESTIERVATHVTGHETRFWSPVFDALDELDLAIEAIDGGHTDGAVKGLDGIRSRLEAVLRGAGYVRHGAPGAQIDGRLHRVVGIDESQASGGGAVARIVRAAVTRGDDVVRVGEVIATRSVS